MRMVAEFTLADTYRHNAAKQGIQMFEGHFISVLAGVADNFSIHQWDDLIKQPVLTLNLLRQSNKAPKVSAYAYHHGQIDYNQMTLAPM